MEVEGAERRIGDRRCNVGRQLSTLRRVVVRRAYSSVRSIWGGVDTIYAITAETAYPSRQGPEIADCS